LPTNPDSFFKKVLKDLRPLFKENGFRASSQNFILESVEGWAIINFQKSRWLEPSEKTFYVNVAITSKRWMAFLDEPTDKAPAYFSCIWRGRAEQFGPDRSIKQWTIRDETSSQETVKYLQKLLGDYVIPAMRPMMSEAGLLESWARFTNLNYPALKAKSVLMAADDNLRDFRQTVQSLHQTFGTGVVARDLQRHMEQLQRKFPSIATDI
jgi:hypothetical protein